MIEPWFLVGPHGCFGRKGELPTVNVTTAEMDVHIEAGVLVSVLWQSIHMLCLMCECK